MKYLRIDGSTTLEDRESAIQQFNNPEGGVCCWLWGINRVCRTSNKVCTFVDKTATHNTRAPHA